MLFSENFLSQIITLQKNENLWVCDSGATCHMKWSKEGMRDLKPVNEKIEVGDGYFVGITMRGIYERKMKMLNGDMTKITSKNLL